MRTGQFRNKTRLAEVIYMYILTFKSNKVIFLIEAKDSIRGKSLSVKGGGGKWKVGKSLFSKEFKFYPSELYLF